MCKKHWTNYRRAGDVQSFVCCLLFCIYRYEMLLYAASMRGGYSDSMIEKKTRKAEIGNDKNSESELTLFVVVLHLYKKKDNRVMI